jgi:hypothetical protein
VNQQDGIEIARRREKSCEKLVEKLAGVTGDGKETTLTYV